MDNFGNDVAQKMKSALKAKLIELDAYVDDELPEYIMVMVANKKSKAQMTEDLSLFLGDNTELFTDWLHDVLNRLQAVAIGRTELKSPIRDKHVEIKKSPKTVVASTSAAERKTSVSDREQPAAADTSEPRPSSRSSGSSSSSSSSADERDAPDVEELEEFEAAEEEELVLGDGEDASNEDQIEETEDEIELKVSVDAVDKVEEKEAPSGDTDPQYEFLAIKAEQESDDLLDFELGEQLGQLKDQPPPLPPPELPPPPPPPPPPESSKRRVDSPSTLKTAFGPKLPSSKPKPAPRAARIGSDPSYIPISLSTTSKSRQVETTRIVKSINVKASTNDRSAVLAGHKRKAPSSSVGAVVRRQFPLEENEDKYDPRHPSIGAVASTIQVSKRRSSLPVNKQANTALLLKAVNEAEKSILQSAKRTPCLPVRDRSYEPQLSSTSSNLFTRGYLQRHQQEDKYQASKYIAEKFLPRFTIKRPKEELSLRVSVTTRPTKPSPPTATSTSGTGAAPVKAVETVEAADSTEHLSEDEEEEGATTEVEDFAEEESGEEEAGNVTDDNEVASAVESVASDGESEEIIQEVEEEDRLDADKVSPPQSHQIESPQQHQQHEVAPENRVAPTFTPKFYITLDGVGSTLFGSRLKNTPLWDNDEMDIEMVPPVVPPSPAPVVSNGIRWGAREQSATYDDSVAMEEHNLSMPDNLDGIQFVVINREANETPVEMAPVYQNEILEPRQHAPVEAMDHEQSREPASRPKLEERCRFWPTCKHGTLCEYHHPSVTCKAFPNCKFGNQCRYIHPNCMFDALCTKRDCPFTHASPRNLPLTEQVAPVPFTSTPIRRPIQMRSIPATLPIVVQPKIRCRNFPTCSNVDCTFYHPKPCRYAMRCTRPDCTFSHPDAPTRDKMKWSKSQVTQPLNPTSISGRAFAVEQVRQKIVVTTTAKVGDPSVHKV